jgi:pheromone shutdown protein TraB
MIVASIGWIGITQGFVEASHNALYWFVAHAIPTGIGGLIGLGHPATILAAAVTAPFTSLSPVIGAGHVGAFVQTWFAPPTVQEIRSVGDDIAHFTSWWRNRLLRVLLVFILTTIGSIMGTWVAGVEIFSNAVQ